MPVGRNAGIKKSPNAYLRLIRAFLFGGTAGK
jgi:hypothetical protein